MQKNVLQSLLKFFSKYIWLLCLILFILECISTAYSASVLMKRSSYGVMESTSGDISSRVNSTLMLLEGLAESEPVSDLSELLFDRAVSLLPLQESYHLFMMAITDEECNVVSADETDPSGKRFNLMFRDYMQELYATGKYQITDPIVAGSDGKTLNYTIAYPILKDDKVMGSIFGAIYFDDIQTTLDRNSSSYGRSFFLFGKEQTIISSSDDSQVDLSFDQLSQNTIYFGTEKETILTNMKDGKNGSYWSLGADGLHYVLYQNVLPANWTLFYRINFWTMIFPLLPATIGKIMFYIFLCALVSKLSKKILTQRLKSVNQLLDKMSLLQLQLFESDNEDYTDLLDISRQGLIDQLTGLATRTVLFNRMKNWQYDSTHPGAVMYIDLDNLKIINDTYGHEAGDAAIVSFASVLKQFEKCHDAIAARYGGDEFILAVRGYENSDIAALAEELCASLHNEIVVNDNRIPVNASIGIALYPKDGIKPEELISKADFALYSAKHSGKNRYIVYSDPGMLM